MLSDFEDFVNKENSREIATKAPEDYHEKQLAEWKDYLDQLYQKVESFLSQYTNSKKINIEYGSKEIFEEKLGTYEVPTITIIIGGKKISFDPIGTYLIGARGRVDMIGPRGSVRIVLVDADSSGPQITVTISNGLDKRKSSDSMKPEKINWAWKFITPPPYIKYIDIEKEVFLDILMDIAND